MSVSVCLCVCLSASISPGTARPAFIKLLEHVTYDRGWVLLCRRCDTLCTSGFMDSASSHILARNSRSAEGEYSKRLNRRQHEFDTVAYTQTGPPGGSTGRRRSLISTIALFFYDEYTHTHTRARARV